jgi:hypothetical protein
MTEKTVTLEWCGPVGHVSKTFGELVPGTTYVVEAGLAETLVHSDFWRAPTKRAAKAAEE